MIDHDSSPRLSVGLAVYNGEQYLADAIEVILGQTYDDLELIICDNDSTDATADICEAFVAKDSRVRYYRNPFNIGGVRNENRTFFLSRGEYFKLAAHDDLVSLNFLDVCVRALDDDPDADVCVPSVIVIDDEGAELSDQALVAGLESTPARRMRALSDEAYMCEATYGLVRMSTLREVRPQGNFLSSDRIMLCELAARAPFCHEPDAVLYRRLHEGNAFRDWRARMAWFQPELKRSGRLRLPFWHQLFGYLAMITRAPLGVLDRMRCTFELARWSVRMSRSLVADIVYATRMLAMGRSRRRARYAGEGRLAAPSAEPTKQTVTTALLVLGGVATTAEAAGLTRRFLDEIDRTHHYPTVLASGDVEPDVSDLLDGLRSEGIPVMVARPFCRPRGPRAISAVLELVYWIRAADATVVHIPAGDSLLARTVRRAGRLAHGVESVVEISRSAPRAVAGG